jgi:hypothetical protein
MEEVYRLFDRLFRTETALARLAELRRRVGRFKRLGRALDKLSSPTLEKALTVLGNDLLPTTTNAVERSNRRYRKAQRSITRCGRRGTFAGESRWAWSATRWRPIAHGSRKVLHQARSGTQKLRK